MYSRDISQWRILCCNCSVYGILHSAVILIFQLPIVLCVFCTFSGFSFVHISGFIFISCWSAFPERMLSCETVPKMPQNAFFFTGNNQILKLIFMRNQNFAQLSACRFVEKRNRQIAYELFNGYQNFTRIVRIEKSRASADTRGCVTYCFKDLRR
mgnify:CR=1 FL=1